MPVERRGPTGSQRLRQHGRQGPRDNRVHRSARPEAEALRQGEGREGLAGLGLYGHVAKAETLHTAYALAKQADGAPGIDGVTFAAIEEAGAEKLLAELRDALVTRTYVPLRNRRVEIPKDGGKVRVLGIPAIRDRVVQGALKLILEPIFEADFHEGSFGYRPKRTGQQAVDRVAEAIVRNKTRVIDVDLAAYFDSVRHDVLLAKVARRVRDREILHLLKLMLKASGKRGVPQGGVMSPLLSNIYLTEVDAMLERAKAVTRNGAHTYVEYVRYADDLVILVNNDRRQDWLVEAAGRRLRAELAKLDVRVNEEKSRTVDLSRGESFGFLGFDFRRLRSLRGAGGHRTRRGRRRARRCCGSSRRCSGALGHNQWSD